MSEPIEVEIPQTMADMVKIADLTAVLAEGERVQALLSTLTTGSPVRDNVQVIAQYQIVLLHVEAIVKMDDSFLQEPSSKAFNLLQEYWLGRQSMDSMLDELRKLLGDLVAKTEG